MVAIAFSQRRFTVSKHCGNKRERSCLCWKARASHMLSAAILLIPVTTALTAAFVARCQTLSEPRRRSSGFCTIQTCSRIRPFSPAPGEKVPAGRMRGRFRNKSSSSTLPNTYQRAPTAKPRSTTIWNTTPSATSPAASDQKRQRRRDAGKSGVCV
jgi:hypothetical protein